MKPVSLAIELDQDSKGYAYLHLSGCRDLKDPEPIGPVHSLEDAGAIVAEFTGWDCEGEYPLISPCARKAFTT
jgi:hypothetical protein